MNVFSSSPERVAVIYSSGGGDVPVNLLRSRERGGAEGAVIVVPN